jgi:cardiolipin synthase
VPEYTGGNRLTLLRNGEQYFPALVEAIDAARAEVFLESYIYASDQTGSLIADALARAAARGVATHLLLDGFGAKDFAPRLRKLLIGAGVELLVFRPHVSPWPFWKQKSRMRRMHRKLASIDGKLAFVGGINIVDDFEGPPPAPPRYDYAVRIEGPLAARVRADAARLWARVAWATFGRRWPGFAKLKGRAPPPVLPALSPSDQAAGAQRAALVVRDSVRHRRDIEDAYIEYIGNAREEVLIANAYFFPGRRFRRALSLAAQRGVRVTLLLQGRAEYPFLYYASRALYDPLLAAGVDIREYYQSYLHAKVAVFDNRMACIGSSNIDPFSLLLAREANVFVDDAGFTLQLRADLHQAIENGALAVPMRSRNREPFLLRLRIWLCYRFARVLMTVYGYDRQQ